MPLTLAQLNAATQAEFTALLDGSYEHSPWIAEAAWAHRPFHTLAHLKHTLVQVLREAGREAQLKLIRAHPELAGKAMVSQSLTAESTNEQGKAGLTNCTPEEFALIQRLNAEYNAKFGWPFILAVRGPNPKKDGLGLSRAEIISTFQRRLAGHPDHEFAECLRNIHRVVEIRLNDKFGVTPALGQQVWDWAEALALHSDPGFKEAGQLTVTYLTDAHRAVAAQLQQWMQGCGFDEVGLDAVGNVVGIYRGSGAQRKTLLTGSHYDTVRNGGKYDGRLGILVPMAVVRELHRAGRRMPFDIEVVGFAEEEGQRYKATFLGSGALTGDFDPAWLNQTDSNGVRMQDAMRAAGLPATLQAIEALRRYTPGCEQARLRNFGMTLGIRDSRKIEAVYDMTEHDVREQARFDDSIGIFPEFIDGYGILILPTTGRYFALPYRNLLPQRVGNLLVAGRSSGGDRISHAATRNMGCCAVLGQGAGIAAAVSLHDGVGLRDVSMARVQTELQRQGVRYT